MAIFQYKAVAVSGESIEGEMEASSSREVIARLQDAGNMPISAEPAGGGFGLGNFGLFRNRVSVKEVGHFTQQLATLLGAGLPLDRALQIMLDLADGDRVEKMVRSIREQVREGASLSDALEAQHGVFSRLYVNMVRAGEVGGALENTLARLAEYLERSQELRSSVKSALIYPIMLMVMAAASLIVLLVFVVPGFAPMFEEMGADLPTLTKIVLGAANALRYYWWALLGTGIAVVVYFRNQMANPESRYRWDERWLKLRLVGDLVSKMDMARMARTVGTLMNNGVPVLSALSIGRKVMSNLVLAEGVAEAAEEVKTGGSVAHTMAKSKRFPKLALQLIAVGEETGKLDEMLLKVADTYDEEVRVAVDRLLALLVPLLTLLMALLIGGIVISIILAIISVNDLVV